MKFFSAATLLLALVISAVVCVPFSPLAKEHPERFALEVRLSCPSSGHVQVYYDSGHGFEERHSTAATLISGGQHQTYRLQLPVGTYTQFRLDPIDGDTPVTLESLQVVRDDTVIRSLDLGTLVPVHEIDRLQPAAKGLEVRPTPGKNDPQLLVPLTPPLTIAETFRSALPSDLRHVAFIFAGIVLALVALDRVRALRSGLGRAANWFSARPVAAIWVVAAFGVIASSYPVVFLGKSFVSPNMGTVLLYDEYPTLPGYHDSREGLAMGSDVGAIMWQQVPLSMVQARSLAHGEIPVWNRYNSTGTPLLGQGQSMLGDPLHFLVIAANGAAWAWDLKYLIAKWLFAAGLGLVVFAVAAGRRMHPGACRERHAAGAAALVAGAAAFVGFFVYRINHPAFFSICYAPWPLYCWVRITQARGLRATAAWAGGLMLANFAEMNSGTAKEAYMLLLTMNLAGAVALLAATAPWRERLAKLVLLGWAGALFALITAPIVGTFLHDLRHAYTSYNSASAYQIQPSLLLGAFDEIFYRPLMPLNQTFSPSLNFLLLLGVLYFAATLRTQFRNCTATALAGVSLLPLVLAFGVVPPEWIVRVPFLANVDHIDNTFSCALVVLWTVLAGVGFATAIGRLGSPEGRSDLAISGLLLAALVGGWIAFGQAVHRPIYGPAFTVNELGHPLGIAPTIWWYLGSLLIATAVFAAVARHAFRRRALHAPALLALVFCAIVLCWRMGLQAWNVGFESFVVRPTVRAPFHGTSAAVKLVQSAQATEPSRAFGIRSNFLPGWNDVYALETIHGPDALMSPSYRELISSIPNLRRLWDWRLYVDPGEVPHVQPYFDFLNVRYYFDLRSDQALMGRTLKLLRAADLDVYESPTAWPRAFFTNRVFVYDQVGQLTAKIAAERRPFAAMQSYDLTGNDSLAVLWGEFEGRTVQPATHYHLTPNSTAFHITADGPGIVVLSEAWWPKDVRVFVNGEKRPVLRVNHAFVGVTVPSAGAYEIVVRYVPAGWFRNVLLAVAGLLLTAGTGLAIWRVTATPEPNESAAAVGGAVATESV